MSATPIHPEFDEAENARHYRVLTRRLVDMAMEMAEQVLQDAKTPPDPGTPKPDHTDRFERASRTVRRAILLARKLAEPLPQPRPVAHPLPSPPLDRTAARRRIIRAVEDAISREDRYQKIDTETLEAELLDRLDRTDLEDDIAARPIEQIISDIARDLGVGFLPKEEFRVGKRRTPEDIEHLEAHAAAPLPTRPGPARTPTRAPDHRIILPDDPAEAVAMVLALGKIRDG